MAVALTAIGVAITAAVVSANCDWRAVLAGGAYLLGAVALPVLVALAWQRRHRSGLGDTLTAGALTSVVFHLALTPVGFAALAM